MTADTTAGPAAAATLGVGEPPILACYEVSKTFPGVRALENVDFAVRPGEIHALVGENGAGKSTLVKVLTGVYAPDGGHIEVKGEAVHFSSPSDAADRGIAIVHQDSPLVPLFDVTRNAFVGRERASRRGILDFATMRAATASAIGQVGARFRPETLVRDLAVGQREQVAIVSALVQDPSILILDEPTASLDTEDVDRLFDVIRGLQAAGVTIIYISHHLDEIFRLASHVTVLRDGRRAGTLRIAETTRAEVIRLMIGRELSQLYPKETLPIGEPICTISGLRQGTAVRGVDLTVRRGEIVGLAGLVGAGRTETALTLFGASSRSGGEVILDGRSISPSSPHAARQAGLALIPEDRRNEGLITDLSVRENLTLSSLRRWATGGLIHGRAERHAASELVQRLRIATPSLSQLTRNLSGGNQQKVVIGRWLASNAKLYIFDEPTTGVDVAAKTEIYQQMTAVARGGAGVIFISSEFDELLGMCDRIAVMKKGRVVKEFARGEADARELLHWAAGADDSDAATAGLDGVDAGSFGAEMMLPAPTPRLTLDAEATPSEIEPTRARGWRSALPQGRAGLITRWSTIGGMVAAVLLIGLLAPSFFTIDTALLVLKQGSILALIAVALTVILVPGGFDMSVGAVNQLTANLAAGTILAGAGTAAAVLLGSGVGFLFGLANGILIVLLRMPPFVATLGTMFVAIGVSFAYNGGHALTLFDQPEFFWLGQGYVGPIPVLVIVVAVLAVLLHLLLKRTRTGLRMYTVGGSIATARLRGVSRGRAILLGSLLAGGVAGLSGVLFASYGYGASALGTGLDFLITALAAAFLGSALSRTGELDVLWTIVASMFLAAISSGLILLGASNQVLPGIQGAILIASIVPGVIRRRDIGQVLIF